MRLLKKFLAFTTLVVILFSCKKEKSLEDGKLPGFINAEWEFKEAGLLFNGVMDSANILAVEGTTTLTMSGSKKEGQGNGEIFLQITTDQTLGAGSYTTPQILFQYAENGEVLYQNSPVQSEEFTITITEIDSVSVTGTFSGIVQDGLGNSRTISEGKFTVAITKGSQQPIGSGQLTVWSKNLCNDGGSIQVTINNQTLEITTATASEPLCGVAGTPTFNLPVGIYSVIAVCGSDSLSYDITIVKDNCTALEIDFANPPPGDYLPLTPGSFWEYSDASSPSTKQKITVDGEDVLDGRSYKRLVSDLGDTMFYRTEGNKYFQFVVLNFGGFVNNPPSAEIIILQDDLDANESWETPPFEVDYSGLPLTVKLRSTITRRDYSDNFNGVAYNNLIEVVTELYISFDGGATFEPSGSSYVTIFSKGVGIVYYQDLNRNIEWNISQYNIVP